MEIGENDDSDTKTMVRRVPIAFFSTELREKSQISSSGPNPHQAVGHLLIWHTYVSLRRKVDSIVALVQMVCFSAFLSQNRHEFVSRFFKF